MRHRASREQIDHVRGQASSLMVSLGFQARKKGWFTYPLDDKFLGVMTLSHATEGEGGYVVLYHYVGVRCHQLEQLYCRIAKEKDSTYSSSISCTIGHLMPSGGRWHFRGNDQDDARMRHMMAAIKKYAIPFMKEHASLKKVCEKLKTLDYIWVESCEPRYLVALFLLGKPQQAKQYLAKRVREIRAEKDPDWYSEWFLEYARDLSRFCLSKKGSAGI